MYDITVSNATGTGLGNYAISYTKGTLTVTEKLVPLITWNTPDDITYGTALTDLQLNATASYLGETIEGTFTYSPVAGTILDAGISQNLSVTFTPNDVLNYAEVSKNVAINVNKVELTASVVNYEILVNEDMPIFEISYYGFVNNDDEEDIDQLPQVACSATSTNVTGVFDITLSGGLDDNYTFNYEDALLTIVNKYTPIEVLYTLSGFYFLCRRK